MVRTFRASIGDSRQPCPVEGAAHAFFSIRAASRCLVLRHFVVFRHGLWKHGHHRAMTRAAEKAVAFAADPTAFPEHLAAGLTPWQVSKFYLPAWSGGGSTYDDEVPPPVATLVVHVPGDDVTTGAPFAHIGEWSRAAHLSQGMGHWQEDPVRSWPLHLLLKATAAQNEESDIRDGLSATVGEL